MIREANPGGDHRGRSGRAAARPAAAPQGIDAVILEARSRGYVEARIRAGVLEQGTIEVLREAGVGERLDREGLVHGGIYLQLRGRAPPHPDDRADRRPDGHHLRPDRGRQGPDRRPARGGRPAAASTAASRDRRLDRRRAGRPLHPRGRGARAALRPDRRLRRLPRRLPRGDPRRRADDLRSANTRSPGWASSPTSRPPPTS